jgi:hypothetical protein
MRTARWVAIVLATRSEQLKILDRSVFMRSRRQAQSPNLRELAIPSGRQAIASPSN